MWVILAHEVTDIKSYDEFQHKKEHELQKIVLLDYAKPKY